MIIDAHAHLWRGVRHPQPWIDPISMAAIHRDFWLDDLVESANASGISGSIVVQALNSRSETVDLLRECVGPVVRGVVGWIDLEGDVRRQTDDLAEIEPRAPLVGIRHLAHLDPDPGWLTRPRVHEGLRRLGALGLPFDLVVRPDQLAVVPGVLAAAPDTRFVLDHLGKPPIAGGDLGQWTAQLGAIAVQDNVVAKLSGLAIEARWDAWDAADLRPVIDSALDAFGPHRLMFGSDWPLVLLTGGLHRWIDQLTALLTSLSDAEQQAIFADNALQFYSKATTHV